MPSFMIIGLLLLWEGIFEVFLPHMGMAAIFSWSCDLDHLIMNFLSPFPRRLHTKFGLTGQAVSEKKMFENNDHIHVFSPGGGVDKSPGIIMFS